MTNPKPNEKLLKLCQKKVKEIQYRRGLPSRESLRNPDDLETLFCRVVQQLEDVLQALKAESVPESGKMYYLGGDAELVPAHPTDMYAQLFYLHKGRWYLVSYVFSGTPRPYIFDGKALQNIYLEGELLEGTFRILKLKHPPKHWFVFQQDHQGNTLRPYWCGGRQILMGRWKDGLWYGGRSACGRCWQAPAGTP